ncbi:hypothetical protein AMTR_s00183p00041560 [Amborella trichopoda]|uniref:Reverse transcriptase Ty1/copia-type domain-containing protein n=1 Tax=Amborella trichopoda TaxID=13333 RepID=U5D3A7_AMBTC|nr:hypothetical protein AMTR_s00183p00041560 [Amborella trichopoda]
MPTAKELCAVLKIKYRKEDSSKKKYLLSRYLNFKITQENPILAQIHDFHIVTNELASNGIKLDVTFHVRPIIDKLPSSWTDYINTLMHKSEDFSLKQLLTHMRIEEETRLRDVKEYKSHMVARAHTDEGPR